MHIRSKNYEESGHGPGMDLLTITYELRVLNPYTRSGLIGKCNHLRPIYLRNDDLHHDSQLQTK